MSDNEIKVLLTADLANLQEGMAAGTEAVQTNTEAMAAAVKEAAGTIQEAQAAVAESVGAATQALQASLEETAAAITGTNKQTMESVAAEAAAFNAAVQAKIEAQTRLNAAFAGSIGSTAAVGEAEAALDQAMAVGAITASEYAAYIDRLNIAEVELAASTEAATVATEENTAAMVLNGGVARELGVMIGELARGNYTRLEGSTITLANRTGFLSTALNAVLSPLGLVTLAAGAVGYEVFEAGQKFDAMEGTVLATGEAAGYTAGQLVGMADQIGQASGDISTATEVIQQLAASGRFAGQDLQLVGQAATDMAQLTGQSIQSIVGQIEKLQEDPVKAVAKLNDQYHFLTVAQFQEIEAAQQSGDAMKAASLAYEAMADKMQSRTDELNTHANILIRSCAEYAEGQISAQQLLDLERQLAAQRLAIDTKYYQDKARLNAADPVAVARDDSAIVKAQQTMQQTLARAEQQFHANSLRGWKEHAKQIEGAMQGAINGMLFQHQTLRQGIASVALVIGEDFIQEAVMKPLDKWIAAEAMKVSASVSTSTTLQAQRVADSIAEATQSTASVARAAGVAGANGLASFAAAPWPIDMGAPAFGATMAAAALSFAPVASAAGGWERVPFDGTIAELHRDEMVLPKHIADPMRQMAQRGGAGSGSGGGDHYHFHSFDSRGIADYARRRPSDLAAAVKHVARRGHLGHR